MRAIANEKELSRRRGFTLLELIVVLVIISVLSAIAIPAYVQWRRSLTYRDATRQVVSFLRTAKSEAISSNRQRRADFDTVNGRFGLRIGDRANDTDWAATAAPALWTTLDRQVTLTGPTPNTNSVDAADNTIHVVAFNPNGTASFSDDPTGITELIIRDDTGNARFSVQVTPSGRIRFEHSN